MGKRVCIITCNNADNYGARLQAYALAACVKSMGHQVRIIDYAPWYVRFYVRQWYFPGLNPKEWLKLILRRNQRRLQISKHNALEAFSRKYLPLTLLRYQGIEHLRLTPPTADVYVTGSDQIWNATLRNGRDPAYYLDFGPESVKRISYAASFATDRVPQEYDDFVRTNICRLDAVSVREESAQKIVDGYGVKADVVCDPAFLLDAQTWSAVASGAPDGEPYLLIYDFFGSEEIKRVAMRVARLRGLKIYSVSPTPQRYVHRNFSDCTVECFVDLVRNSECVVSNSLHGSIFSIIFRKDFYVVERADGLNVRMADLLGRYHLEHRMVDDTASDATLTSHIDYQTVVPRLDSDIEASKRWLHEHL